MKYIYIYMIVNYQPTSVTQSKSYGKLNMGQFLVELCLMTAELFGPKLNAWMLLRDSLHCGL